MRLRGALLWLTLAMLMLGVGRPSMADHQTFKVIVNPERDVDAVDRELLRDAYLKKVEEWSDGETIRPIDLPETSEAREHFTEAVLRKTPAQLRAYWNQQIFSGKGVPPPEATSVADVIAYVLANKGAVGYIPADADPGKARVVGIR